MRIFLPDYSYVDEIVYMKLTLRNHNKRSEMPIKISVVGSGKYKFVDEVSFCRKIINFFGILYNLY